MELTLAVLSAFVLACVAWPQIARSRPHFIVGIAAVALAMFFSVLGICFGWRVFLFLSGLTQIVAFILLVMAGSGMRLAQWGQAVVSSLSEL